MALVDLTPFFEIVSYSGGCENDDQESYGVVNLLNELPRDRRHCSALGLNVDLVLAVKEPVLLTNLVVRGMLGGSVASIKNGMVWVSEAAPRIEEYTGLFDDCDFKALQKMHETAKFLMPSLYFETDPESLQFSGHFDPVAQGTHLHFKFISSHPHPKNFHDHIDFGTIGIVGNFLTNVTLAELQTKLPFSVPMEMDLERFFFSKNKLNAFHSDLLNFIDGHFCCILFSNDKSLQERLSQLPIMFASVPLLNFFFILEPLREILQNREDSLASAIANISGITSECLAIVHVNDIQIRSVVFAEKSLHEALLEDFDSFITHSMKELGIN